MNDDKAAPVEVAGTWMLPPLALGGFMLNERDRYKPQSRSRHWDLNNAWRELDWSFLAVLLECNLTPLIAMDETFQVFKVMCFAILPRVSEPRVSSAKRAF